MSYHPDNLKLQPYEHAKVIELAEHAARLGVQFNIAGIPFGADYDAELWAKYFEESNNCASVDHQPGTLGSKA